ncbi:hypothetical protein R5R35_002396 [Gryllus longicercus]|uniref:phytanoyl-CoA dioxygenase n=1 Tax=Gryllus longicercus TaxID=2509291 RepID=A0AAN9VTJ0_9ORTH
MAAERIRVLNRHLVPSQPAANATAAAAAVSLARDFIYTLNNPRFTLEQRQFYEDNGYIVFPRLVGEELLDECADRFRALCDGKVERGAITLMADVSLRQKGAKGEYLYNKAQDIVYDDVFSKYILLPEVLDIVECITGPNIMAMHTMLINKPPDSGALTSKHPLHQDLHYFPFRPADRIVASWTAMEQVTEANGCLVVVPGSHRGVLMPHGYPKWENGVNKAYHGVINCDNVPTINLEMEKGDTVFFHPLLLHGSGVNRTQGFRKAISCHYAASECEYIDVRGTTQEIIAEEIKEMAKRKGFEADFTDLWRYRSRLARGQHMNL